MGSAAAENIHLIVGDPEEDDDQDVEPIAKEYYERVKFGKSATCESAIFFSKGLITSSSDGLIEVWDGRYSDLNTSDFAFQKDSVMGHSSSVLCMTLSNDSELLASGDDTGRVKVWKLANGKCLRQYQAHDGSPVTCLDLSRDSSRLLTASSDGTCREFGLVSQTILQEYNGHTSYIHHCSYFIEWNGTDATSWVVTGSADGTVRLWQKGQCIRILQPRSKTKSFVVDETTLLTENPAIHTILAIPNNENQILVVPRSNTAYLLTLDGTVLQSYSSST